MSAMVEPGRRARVRQAARIRSSMRGPHIPALSRRNTVTTFSAAHSAARLDPPSAAATAVVLQSPSRAPGCHCVSASGLDGGGVGGQHVPGRGCGGFVGIEQHHPPGGVGRQPGDDMSGEVALAVQQHHPPPRCGLGQGVTGKPGGLTGPGQAEHVQVMAGVGNRQPDRAR